MLAVVPTEMHSFLISSFQIQLTHDFYPENVQLPYSENLCHRAQNSSVPKPLFLRAWVKDHLPGSWDILITLIKHIDADSPFETCQDFMNGVWGDWKNHFTSPQTNLTDV